MTTSASSVDAAGPSAVFELGTAFCTAKCLLTALELSLFTVLGDDEMTAEELRVKLDLHPRGTPDFLDVLAALDLLEKNDGRYRNSALAGRHLVRTGDGYIGGFLERANHMLYPAWGRFGEMLRTGKPTAEADYMEMIKEPNRLRSFLGMMDALTTLIVPELARAIEWTAYRSMVDVGGARGNLTGGLIKAHPHLSGTVFDLPEMRTPFDEHMRALGLEEKTTFQAGDFFTDPIPSADVVVIGHVLHDWSPDECRALVRKAFDAVRPGGKLVVYDRMVDEEGTDLTNLIISLDMMLTTPGGAEYPPSEYQGWLTEAGFGSTEVAPLGENDTVVIGHKAG
ncbi:methyltransferase [Amycolatopsis coloradensis]|uniref:Methyltransferase n=1 Tax=Amycolatopsis coloradensis TaxID=76021 RepID=A0ACD5BK25_9PSEU